jgi:hypothetical protein
MLYIGNPFLVYFEGSSICYSNLSFEWLSLARSFAHCPGVTSRLTALDDIENQTTDVTV